MWHQKALSKPVQENPPRPTRKQDEPTSQIGLKSKGRPKIFKLQRTMMMKNNKKGKKKKKEEKQR